MDVFLITVSAFLGTYMKLGFCVPGDSLKAISRAAETLTNIQGLRKKIQYRGLMTEKKLIEDYRNLTVIKECQKTVFKKGPWESAMIMVFHFG